MYGRVGPDQVQGLLAAERADVPFLPAYRGSADLPGVAQVAEVAALHACSDIGHPRVEAIAAVAGTAAHYRVVVSGRTLLVERMPSTLAGYGACSDVDESKQPNSKTVWSARVIDPDVLT